MNSLTYMETYGKWETVNYFIGLKQKTIPSYFYQGHKRLVRNERAFNNITNLSSTLAHPHKASM